MFWIKVDFLSHSWKITKKSQTTKNGLNVEELEWKLYRFFSRFTSHISHTKWFGVESSPLFFIKHSPDIYLTLLSSPFSSATVIWVSSTHSHHYSDSLMLHERNEREHTFKCGRETRGDFSFLHLSDPKNEWLSFRRFLYDESRRSHYTKLVGEKAFVFSYHCILHT